MEKWELYIGSIKIAEINQIGMDQPWFIGDFYPTDHYENYRPLFLRAARFIESEDFESEESNNTFEEIDALPLNIKRLADNKTFNQVMVSLTANEIWWRV